MSRSSSRRRVKSIDWRPSGFHGAEWRLIQMARHAEKHGAKLTAAELKALRKEADKRASSPRRG